MKTSKLFAAVLTAATIIANAFGSYAEVGSSNMEETDYRYEYVEMSAKDSTTESESVKAIANSIVAPATYENATNEPAEENEETQEPATLRETQRFTGETAEAQTTTNIFTTTAADETATTTTTTKCRLIDYDYVKWPSEATEAQITAINLGATATATTTTAERRKAEYRMFPGESYRICDGVYFTAKRITEFELEEFPDYIRLSAKNCAWFAVIANKSTGDQYCPAQYELYQELKSVNIFTYWGKCDGDFYDERTELIEKSSRIVHKGDRIECGANGYATKSCSMEVTAATSGYYSLEVDDGDDHTSYLVFSKENQSRYESWIHYVDYKPFYNNGEFYVYKRTWDYDFIEWDPSIPEEELIEEGVKSQGEILTIEGIDGIMLGNLDYSIKKIEGDVHVFATCTDDTRITAEYIIVPLAGKKDKSQKELYRDSNFKVLVQEELWGDTIWYEHDDLIAWGERSQETISFTGGEIKTVGSNCSLLASYDVVINATHVAMTTLLEGEGWTAMIVGDDRTSALTASDEWKHCFGRRGICCVIRGGELPGKLDTTVRFDLTASDIIDSIRSFSKLENSGKDHLNFAPYLSWKDGELVSGVFNFHCEKELLMGQTDWEIWAELHTSLEDDGNVLDYIGAEVPVEYTPNCRNVIRMTNWRWDISGEIVEDVFTIIVNDKLKGDSAEYTLQLEPATENSSTMIRWDNAYSCYTILCVYDGRTTEALSRIMYGVDKC